MRNMIKKRYCANTGDYCFVCSAETALYPGWEVQLFIAVASDGIPFGIGKMCVWMVPRGFDLGGTLAVWTMNFLIGGLIGSVVLLAMIGQAIIYLSVFLLTVITGIHKIPRIK